MRLVSRHGVMLMAFAVVAIAATSGCGRRVVLDPDEVHRHNTDWTLRRAAPPPTTAPATPTTDAGAPALRAI
jgi:hypothetical protein